MKTSSLAKAISKGKSVTRAIMNESFRAYEIRGKVVDVGGGRAPDYFSYLVHKNVVSVDAIDLSISGIDLEKDQLPYGNASVDTALLCNVLEHIYNHSFLIS